MSIRFEKCSACDEWYEVYDNDRVIGEFRIYRDMDFVYSGVRLEDFLGYIRIDKAYRNQGILKRVVDEFRIKSLMVDDIEDISIDVLKRIYSRLGFRLIDGSDRFMIKKGVENGSYEFS